MPVISTTIGPVKVSGCVTSRSAPRAASKVSSKAAHRWGTTISRTTNDVPVLRSIARR